MVAVVSFLVVFSHRAADDELPDPELPVPPSSMLMGTYVHAGVVSNGGPCAQVGV